MDPHRPNSLNVLLIAQPGLLRNSLRAFLGGISEIKVVAQMDHLQASLEILGEIHPDVIVMDVDVKDPSMGSLIRQMRGEYPALNCIVLADNSEQQRQALNCGASHALVKGMLGAQLREAILAPPGSVLLKGGGE